MKLRTALVGGAAVSWLFVYACSSSDSVAVKHPVAGEAGEAGMNEPPGQGGAAGEAANGGRAGETGTAGGAAGGESATAGAGGESITGTAGAGGSAGGAGEGGAAGASPAPQVVSSFGCFALSSDGHDVLSNGELAPTVTAATRTACGTEISNNPGALAPEATPTSFVMTRQFVLDSAVSSGTFTLSFAADDATDIELNGQLVASCTPPDMTTNIGACSQSCHTASIPAAALRPAGEINTLKITVINLLSIDAGNGNFGYTGISYTICGASS